jgi:subtilisin family serine protease
VNYPASFPGVMSVAAVTSSNQWATFSTNNTEVDISAVGVDVLSTYPLPSGGTRVYVSWESGQATGIHMIYSQYASTVTGPLVNCYTGGSCEGPGGHICLFERGGTSFYNKVMQCNASGGIATIIYNTGANPVRGTMGHVNNSPRYISTPAVGLARDVGLQLVGMAGQSVTVATQLDDGYARLSGTSMA